MQSENPSFPTQPGEWCAEMLHAAGELVLDAAEALLPGGRALTSAQPGLIRFQGPHPVFDVSPPVETRDPLDPTWKPFREFVGHYLYPLLLNRYAATPLSEACRSLVPLTPEEVLAKVGPVRRWLPPFFPLVTAPMLADRWSVGISEAWQKERAAASPREAKFFLGLLFTKLRRQLGTVRPKAARDKNQRKEDLAVRDLIPAFEPKLVLDVEAGSGDASLTAARMGASVVACFSDAARAGTVWRKARAEGLDILPLVRHLATRKELDEFLSRAPGAFDLVLFPNGSAIPEGVRGAKKAAA